MSAFEKLLGSTLRASNGAEVATTTELAGADAVGLYFSAHWCPPCRGFTPKLAEIYKGLTAKGLKFKMVFVSSDRDEAAFNEYHAEMPWAALPFSERDTKGALSKKYKVQGIPTLVILDKNGNTITTDGRSVVTEDPEGKDFPWTPPSLSDSLGTEFVRGSGEPVSLADLEGKYIGIYFSAHWCPPCRGFTPELVKLYNKLQADGKEFEVIFASSDRDQASFDEYFGTMPWIAVPYADRDRKEALSKVFGVEGIPTFVMLDKDRSVISTSARGRVSADPEGAEFPWHPKPINDLHTPEGINDTASLCVFMEGVNDAEQKSIIADLTPVAQGVVDTAKQSGEDPEVLFFTATSSGGVVDRIRGLTKLKSSDKPQVVLLDIPEDGAFYTLPGDKEVNAQSVTQFLADYRNKALERKQLS